MEREKAPCVTKPTLCQKKYEEQGGELPCALFAKGMCRPANNFEEKPHYGLAGEIAQSQKNTDKHVACPVSTVFALPENDVETEIHADFVEKTS